MVLTEKVLLHFFEENLGVDTAGIDADTLLFSTSLLDSFSMIEMIEFVESQANIRFSPTQVNLDNLDSIRRILAFVSKSTGS